MDTYETITYSLYTNTKDLSYKNGILYTLYIWSHTEILVVRLLYPCLQCFALKAGIQDSNIVVLAV